jgi:UDP-GlcNAc3NAcA epimerase
MKKIFAVVGARPQFVKLAPVFTELRKNPNFQVVVAHTGQHFDHEMSQIFFDELNLPTPNYHLGINGGSHGEMTGRMLAALEHLIIADRPDAVLVVGDTNSTLAGALAASKLHVPVVHLEAGLRSFNKKMPEELNRILTDHMSTLLLCPSLSAVEQLSREGIRAGAHNVGDVMFDAILMFKERAIRRSTILDRLDLQGKPYSVVTIHRAENTDDAERLGRMLAYVQSQHSAIVFPIHPRTRQKIIDFKLSTGGMTVIDPVGYIDMIQLVSGADTLMTDSGGLQKEAYFLGRPCVTLRDETEWTETITHGWNRLWTSAEYAPRSPISAYGNGRAGEKVALLLEQLFWG